MTRARYYLFIPQMYRKIEASGRRHVEHVVEDVRISEKCLLRALDQIEPRGEFSGVIGRQTLKEYDGLPQRLPSEIYWAGLRTLGILRSTIGRGQYHRKITQDAHGTREDEGDEVASAWDPRLPLTVDANGGFRLTAEEASYLRDRIYATRLPPGILGHESLLYWLAELQSETAAKIKTPIEAWCDAAKASDRTFLIESTERARWLSELMNGAQLLYNHLIERDLVGKFPERAEELGLTGSTFSEEVSRWSDRILQNCDWFSQRNDSWFWSWRPFTLAAIPASTVKFISNWSRLVRLSPDKAMSDDAQAIVLHREVHLKGRASRLSGLDPAQLKAFRGAAGAGALNFRWAITKQIAKDIRDGLSTAS